MERESHALDMEPITAPPPQASEPAEEVIEESAESPAPTPERELTVTEELHEAFPELSGEENREQKEVVTECLVGLVESGKMSVPELKHLLPGGIQVMSENREVPDHHRLAGVDEPQLSASGWEEGKLQIYPDFFTDKYNDDGGVNIRQNILNHELGHALHLRAVEIPRTNPDGSTTVEREAVIDMEKYKAKFEAVYDNNPQWQHMYVAIQVRFGNEFRTQECLAQDVADYLSAKDVNDWMRIRLRAMPLQDHKAGWSKNELAAKIAAGELDDPVAAPFVEHAQAVWDFMESELSSKRGLLGQELTESPDESEEESHDDASNWLHYPGSPAMNQHVTSGKTVDLNFLDKMYGKLFGAD